MAKRILSPGGKLENLMGFVKFTHLVQQVERVVLVNGQERWENDAEHSFQLTFIAWYIAENEKLNLDLSKVLYLALAHDVLEAYAGDTYIYASPEILATKKKREQEAVKLIKQNFPHFPSLSEIITEYEIRQTPESKFVYVLDKLLPIINIYLDGGRTWQQKGITLEKMLKVKTEQIALFPDLVPYYEELVAILREKGELF